MSLTDELQRLHQLHRDGALTDDEFAQAKARLLQAADAPAPLEAMNALRRSRSDRLLGGVCGGLAVATGMPAWAVRLIVVLLALWGGAGVLIYLLLWMFVPDDGVPANG